MSSAPIRFAGESPSLDELAGGAPAQINCQVDSAGAVRMRPGLAAWEDFPSTIPSPYAITWITSWRNRVVFSTDQNITSASTAKRVYRIEGAGLAELFTQGLRGGLRPTSTIGRDPLGDYLIFAAGDTPVFWDGSSPPGFFNILGAPKATHVTTIAQRVVLNANDPSGIIYWSGVNNPSSWTTGLDFREAETKRDPVVGLYESSNELVALGTETIQMLSPDPSEVFTPARTIEVGWGSAYSYIGFDEIFMGLDARKRAILCNGRSFEVISSPWIGQQLEEADPSDAWGFRYKFNNWDLGIEVLPTDGRTFAYDAGAKLWTEWRGHDAATGGYGRFGATAAYYWPERGITLVGMSDGRIAQLDPNATTDLGEPIVVQLTSTFENRGSSRLKKCDHLRMRFRRGTLAPGATGHLLLSYRDDLGPFCEPFRIDIGDPSDVAPVVELHSLGTYRQRQWRIVVDSVLFRFAGMEEDFTVLDH